MALLLGAAIGVVGPLEGGEEGADDMDEEEKVSSEATEDTDSRRCRRGVASRATGTSRALLVTLDLGLGSRAGDVENKLASWS